MSSSTAQKATPANTSSHNAQHGLDTDVYNSASSNKSRTRSFTRALVSKFHHRDHLNSMSARSEMSVELGGDDGAAPPPPEFVRKTSRPPLPNTHSTQEIVPQEPKPQIRNTSIHSRSTQASRDRSGSSVNASSNGTGDTQATSIHTLPPLQTRGLPHGMDQLEAIEGEDDPACYDLVQPDDRSVAPPQYSLEQRGEDMFSRDHLQTIFNDPALLLKFTSYLGTHRRGSVPTLIYYLDSVKALRAIRYANAVADALDPIEGQEWTKTLPATTQNKALEEKARSAFDRMVQQDLPAYVTHIFINVVSVSIQRRITGTLPPHLREASEGLAEVFCLSDPSRPDNPIVFASEEFNRTTQYGMSYALGRNCRFLQGPRTNPYSVQRLAAAVKEGGDLSETFINYRRDGSPFLNLLMIAPLRDSRGRLRYYIGAQVDVSGLAKECTDLDGLQRMLSKRDEDEDEEEKKDDFQELSEMFNLAELDIVKKHGGRLHREHVQEAEDTNASWHRPRLLLKEPSNDGKLQLEEGEAPAKTIHGKLSGVYTHYLLVRPYPSLRILFTSPSLRVPGILQSPFMNRIGSSERVREELVAALAEGRGVTAKIRWVARPEDEGRNRWIHATPLIGANGNIGVWMIVLVDEENQRTQRRFRQAPPVASDITAVSRDRDMNRHRDDGGSRKGTMTRKSAGEDDYPPFGSITSGKAGRGGDYEFMAR